MFKKAVALMMIIASIFCFMVPHSANVIEMPKDERIRNAKNHLLSSHDFEVFYVGHHEDDSKLNVTAIKSENINFVSDIDQIKTRKKYKSIWLTEEIYEKYLNDDKINLIDAFLNDGFSIYFIGLQDPATLGKLLIDQDYSERVEGDNSQKIAFVSKNKLGDYFLGSISCSGDAERTLIDTLIASTWNRRNDWNHSKNEFETKTLDSLAVQVSADNGSYFTVGSDWSRRFGWQQYIIHTTYGDYTEWKAAYYLTNPVDGKDYYAMAIEGAMDPLYSVDAAYTINYQSDADSYGQLNLLRKYQPTASPTTNYYSFSLGGEVGKDSWKANVSAMWQVSYNDLDLYDNSAPSQQKMNITFDYNHLSTYAKQTTWQNTCFIYQAPANSTYSWMNNYRKIYFIHYSGGGSFSTSNGSLNYYTQVAK